MFDAVKVKDKCVLWIRDFFEKNGKGCNAVVGISGGKDSSVVAALCVEALGRELPECDLFVACLYGNNENEFVYRTIDRDLDFEADMIEQEKYFWYDYVQAGVEPPYTEAGELVLNSIRKYKGTADKSASTVVLDPTLAVSIQKYLDLREIKLTHEREVKKLDEGYCGAYTLRQDICCRSRCKSIRRPGGASGEAESERNKDHRGNIRYG